VLLGSLAVVPHERDHALRGAVPQEAQGRVLGELPLHSLPLGQSKVGRRACSSGSARPARGRQLGVLYRRLNMLIFEKLAGSYARRIRNALMASEQVTELRDSNGRGVRLSMAALLAGVRDGGGR
jgi:hypothetical protein